MGLLGWVLMSREVVRLFIEKPGNKRFFPGKPQFPLRDSEGFLILTAVPIVLGHPGYRLDVLLTCVRRQVGQKRLQMGTKREQGKKKDAGEAEETAG